MLADTEKMMGILGMTTNMNSNDEKVNGKERKRENRKKEKKINKIGKILGKLIILIFSVR